MLLFFFCHVYAEWRVSCGRVTVVEVDVLFSVHVPESIERHDFAPHHYNTDHTASTVLLRGLTERPDLPSSVS